MTFRADIAFRCMVGYYVTAVSAAFFLFSSDIFITLRCVVSPEPLVRSANTILSQDICDNLQKQDPCRVLWASGTGEINSVARCGIRHPSGCLKPRHAATQRFYAVWTHEGFPSPGNSRLHWHRVRCVLSHRTCRTLWLTKGPCVELSAFIVIVWCIYRLNRALKVSALISTIVTEATVYFLVMVAVQVYSIIGVRCSLGSLTF